MECRIANGWTVPFNSKCAETRTKFILTFVEEANSRLKERTGLRSSYDITLGNASHPLSSEEAQKELRRIYAESQPDQSSSAIPADDR
jgi:hypothetical protein